jgi:hypothetical protein
VLATSGVLGFVLGMLRFGTWQVAVETAQVVAGLVKYPADNPFYMYHMKLWTVLHQVCALLLRAGLTEITISRLVSGLLGMVSFQALAMVVYAFSADAWVAIGAPFLILYSRAAEHGASYPIALMGTDHTYGVVGLSMAVLVVGLLGAGCYRLGGFLLGLAPAVHPSIGLWLGIIVGVCVLWDFTRLREELKSGLTYFLYGGSLTSISLIAQIMMARHVPEVDSAVSAHYLAAFVTSWDVHRQAPALVTVGTILNAEMLIVATVWLKWFSKDLPKASIFILHFVVVSAMLSLLLIVVSRLPADVVPPALLVIMPARVANFNVLAFVPFALGLFGVYRRRLWGQIAIVAFVYALFVNYRSMMWDNPAAGWMSRIHVNPWHVFVVASIGLVAVAIAAARSQRTARLAMTGTTRTLMLGLMVVAAALAWRLPPPYPLLDRTNDPFMAAVAAETHGMVLTGGSFHLVQLYTRRPVLLDAGALDSLPYAPGAGPAMERILREIYHIDFFNPPGEARRTAVVPHRLNKPVWQEFSREKWQEIGHTYDVTQIVTLADWNLDLPIAARSEWFKLYTIPK